MFLRCGGCCSWRNTADSSTRLQHTSTDDHSEQRVQQVSMPSYLSTYHRQVVRSRAVMEAVLLGMQRSVMQFMWGEGGCMHVLAGGR